MTTSFTRAARHVSSIVGLGVVPGVVLFSMLYVSTDTSTLSLDFHHELYPQAELLLGGSSPYPPPDADISGSGNYVWPPLAILLVAPLTAFPPGVADLLIAVLELGCFAVAIHLLGVRDWRVYGALGLWPPVASAMRTSHLTLFICLLVALSWGRRHRASAGIPLGIGLALKLFVWPLAVWLWAERNARGALLALGIGLAGLTAVGLFTPLADYVDLLSRIADAFDQDAYTIGGLLAQLGVPGEVARLVGLGVGAVLLVLAARYRSFGLAVAATLSLTPIVWLDYFALLALPLAIARPRFGLVWLLPLLTWGSVGAGFVDALGIARVLAVFAVLVVVIVHGERHLWSRHVAMSHAPRPA